MWAIYRPVRLPLMPLTVALVALLVVAAPPLGAGAAAAHVTRPVVANSHGLTPPYPFTTPLRPAPRPVLACATSTWNVGVDFRGGSRQRNPNPDSCGLRRVWYFMQSATPTLTLVHTPSTYTTRGMDSFTNGLSLHGLDGWHGNSGDPNGRLPVIYRNGTGHVVHTLNIIIPIGAIVMHPATDRLAVLGWQSPLNGAVALTGPSGVKDLDASCGDGISWDIQHSITPLNIQQHSVVSLAHGHFVNGAGQFFRQGIGGRGLAHIRVHRGDYLYVVIDPRGITDSRGLPTGGNYSCDSTQLFLEIRTVH